METSNYFKIYFELANVRNIKKVELNLNKILLKNPEDNSIIEISNRHYFHKIESLQDNIVALYVLNNGTSLEERIDFLLDEEWEISFIDMNIKESKSSAKNLEYHYLKSEQIYDMMFTNENNFISEFLNGNFINQTACILGPKPNDLFGYDMNDSNYQYLANLIINQVTTLINNGVTNFITNGNIGCETIAFFAIKKLKEQYPNIKNILAVPFLDLDKKWTLDAQERYQRMKENADFLIEIDKTKNYIKMPYETYDIEKYTRKNEFNTDYASNFIIVNNQYNLMSREFKRIHIAFKKVIEIEVSSNQPNKSFGKSNSTASAICF